MFRVFECVSIWHYQTDPYKLKPTRREQNTCNCLAAMPQAMGYRCEYIDLRWPFHS